MTDAPTDAIVAALYDDLRKMARRERRSVGSPPTLQTTAIIHEAYLRLYRRDGWDSREHFLATAATAMRHLLVDDARARLTAKRGGGTRPEPLTADLLDREIYTDQATVRLGQALKDLGTFDSELATLVDCRFFAGFDERETGEVMGISERTVRRRWSLARAWIHREMQL